MNLAQEPKIKKTLGHVGHECNQENKEHPRYLPHFVPRVKQRHQRRLNWTELGGGGGGKAPRTPELIQTF